MADVCGHVGQWRKWVVLALIAGAGLRVGFILLRPPLAGDALVYGGLARNLLQHHVYGWTEVDGAVRSTLIRLPGYPLFLAACFGLFGVGNYAAVLAVQVAIDLGSCLLLAGLARRLYGARAGMAALWLAALCPFTANYVALPLTETLTIFCIALAFYALERWRVAGGTGFNRWLYGLAFALGYAILLRPEQGMLAAAVVPAMSWISIRRGSHAWARLLPVAVLVGLTLLPLVPWTVRNWRVFHVIEPLAPRFANDPGDVNPDGFQRWYRTWAIEFASTEEVYWNYDSAEINVGDLPARAFDTAGQWVRTETLLEEYNATTSATSAFDARFAMLAEERVKAHPLRYYVWLPVARVGNMMFRPRVDQWSMPLRWWRYPKAALFGAGYGLLNLGYFVLAGMGLARRRRGTVVMAMVATVVLRALLLTTLDNSEPRYTLEFLPVLVVLGAGMWGSRFRGEGG